MKKGLLLLSCLFLFSIQKSTADVPHFIGASGVTRRGEELLIVSDKDPGAYFKYPLRDDRGPWISIDLKRLVRVAMPQACYGLDLESIDVLADGRVVALSEEISGLVDEKGLVVLYGGPLSELAGIGLEGVAVRPLENGGSRVAVVWEGGYPTFEKIPYQLRTKVARDPLNPVVLVHDIARDQIAEKIKFNEVNQVELKVPIPRGREPFAQRFRVPDLVWDKLKKNGKEEWGFIALLSSQNSVREQRFLHKMLQRFDSEGKLFGKSIDLNKIMPPSMYSLNWEGLGWFEQGKSLVMIFDNSPEQPPAAYVMELPEDWK
jgi:hypothetical protein